jgi:haloacetate dehalogenase
VPLSDSFLEGFSLYDLNVGDDILIRTAVGGNGPPLLLLHGHPQTHATWQAIAPALAQDFTVVAPDLRGYGDSSKPPSTADHAPYSKRTMAADQMALMKALGHDRFAVAGHDRGGRVAHRLALDHAAAVERIAVFDIAPTLKMYEQTDLRFATKYFWWFFLIQPHPLPERLIGGAVEFYLRHHLQGQSETEGVPCEDLIQEYLRCYEDPACIHAICEDYRASAGIDLEHDRSDRAAGKKLTQPLLALWGAKGTVGQLYDVLACWRDVSASPVEGFALPCGHLVQEERPTETAAHLLAFLKA